MFRLFTKQSLWIINLLMVLLLFCTKLIPFISPSKVWAMGILGLITPFIAAINIVFVVLWMLFGKWRRMLLSIIAIVACWNIFSVAIAGNLPSEQSADLLQANQIKIMSYNVRLMDYYNNSGNKQTRSQLLQFLQQQNASVLCLQEFFSSADSNGVQNIKAICDSCHYPYYAANKNFVTKRGFFGDIIFSKYPIVAQNSIQFDSTNVTHRFQYADVVQKADTFRVFNLHLQSVRFDASDIALLDNKPQASSPKKQPNSDYQQSKVIIRKLKTSYDKRGKQADVIAAEIKQSRYPTLVCGDFNDIPSSYTYFTVRGALNDCFLDKGFGLGRTYNDLNLILRIDNIFYDAKHWKPIDFTISDISTSDHYPISSRLQLR
jgi:endonuclease/exonuclease/phosphatase family metal-dependent hydrolase